MLATELEDYSMTLIISAGGLDDLLGRFLDGDDSYRRTGAKDSDGLVVKKSLTYPPVSVFLARV